MKLPMWVVMNPLPMWASRLLKVHSPTRHFWGQCWCQKPNYRGETL